MHPHHIRGSVLVVDDLGPFDDAVGTQVSAALQGEQFTLKSPLDQILEDIVRHLPILRMIRSGMTHCARIAIDGLEGTPVQVILASPVVRAVHFNDA